MSRTAITLAALVSIGCATQVSSRGPQFVPAAPLVVGQGAGKVVLADVNRDGHLDIVTQHLLERVVAVHVGDGNGRFAPFGQGPVRLGYEPGTIALGDVNADGLIDLAVASRDSNSEYVHILLGAGQSGFNGATATSYPTAASFKGYKPVLRMADLNEDGHLDIVAANGRRNDIQVLLGTGQGILATGPLVKLDTGQSYYSFALGDVDGDAHVDLVTAGSSDGNTTDRIAIKRGDGRAGFRAAAVSLPRVSAGSRVQEVADVDGDRDLDIVLSHADQGHLSILLNAGQNGFVAARNSPYPIGGEAFAVVVADANQDRRPDIFAATVNSVTVLLGDDGAFVPALGSPFPAGPGAYNLAVGDVNEDGSVDVTASSFEGHSVAVLVGR